MSPGFRSALPVLAFLLAGFAAPLMAVIWFSFMPPRSFSFGGVPTLENYRTIFESTSYIPFLWSLGLAITTVVLLALVCYPVAYGLVRVFGKWAMLVTLLWLIMLLKRAFVPSQDMRRSELWLMLADHHAPDMLPMQAKLRAVFAARLRWHADRIGAFAVTLWGFYLLVSLVT